MQVKIDFTDAQRDQEFRDFVATLYPFGITYMSHTALKPDNKAYLFYSDMDWGRHFLENNYFQRDSAMKHAFKTKTHFIPWNSLFLGPDEKKIYNEREHEFKKYNGMSLSFHDGANHHIIGLATDSKSFNLPARCLETPQVLMDCVKFVRNMYKP